MKSFTSSIKVFVLAMLLTAGVSYLFAWTGPSTSAPGGNVPAPINVGLNQQSKLGQLFINTSLTNPYTIGLSVFGESVFNGTVQINSGNPSVGQALVATDVNGTLGWGTAGGSSGTVHISRLSGSGSWTVPSGVNQVKVTLIGGGGGSAGYGRDWGG